MPPAMEHEDRTLQHRRRVDVSLDDTTAQTIDDAPPGQATAPQLKAGATLGRYVVLGLLGEGGMGVVFAAYDPELDRKVALKLWHADGPTATTADEARARLLREAQAMARLSHPNVMTVHDVGTLGERVFVAMEFVDGATLGDWLDAAPRPWPEIVAAFVAAGRGLEAAHAVGLVHRDFKPDNVMIGKDGRVRVMDFGLARPSGTVTTAVPRHVDAATPLELHLTRTGAVMGTPAYMAPEQHLGAATDARTDQFSFAVALHEALHGERPFAGESFAALAENVIAGRVRPVPKGSKVPVRLTRALGRALAADPDQRYSGMSALLAELARDPAAARRRWLAAGLGLALVGALSGAYAVTRPQAWGGAGAAWDEVWGPERGQTLADAFAATGHPAAADSATRVTALLDRYQQDGRAMAVAACEAHVRGEQSDHLLDLRSACLSRRRDAAAALIDGLAALDRHAVDRAVQAAYALPGLAGCADADALLADVAPPDDPDLRASVDAARQRLAEARTQRTLGRYDAGLAIAESVLKDSRELAYQALIAEAELAVADLQGQRGAGEVAEQHVHAAIQAAARAGDRARLAEAWTALVHVVGEENGRGQEGLQWARVADAAVLFLGDPPRARAALLAAEGLVQRNTGDHAAAEATFGRALALYEQLDGAVHPTIAGLLGNLGTVLDLRGRLDEAALTYRRALDMTIETLGPGHPNVAHWQLSLARTYSARGELAEARVWLERALALRRATLGPGHPDVARALVNLAHLSRRQGQLAQARRELEEALQIQEQSLGDRHPDLAYTIGSLALILAAEGDLEAAIAACRRARAIAVASLGTQHEVVLAQALNEGDALVRLGRFGEARPLYSEVLAVWERQHGPQHPHLAYPLVGLAQIELGEGHPDAALPLLTRAAELHAAHPDDTQPIQRAHVAVFTAEALLALRRDLSRARTLLAAADTEIERNPDDPDVALLRPRIAALARRLGR